EEELVHGIVTLGRDHDKLPDRLGEGGLALEDVIGGRDEAGVVVADQGAGCRVAEEEAVLPIVRIGPAPEEHSLTRGGASQLERIADALVRDGGDPLVERSLGRLPGVVLAVLFRLAGPLLRGALQPLLRLVDVADDVGEDRLRERRVELARAREVSLLVRHAARIVGSARGIAPQITAVEALAGPGRNRPSDSGREQDATDGQSESPFHAAVPLSGRVGAASTETWSVSLPIPCRGPLSPGSRESRAGHETTSRRPPERSATDTQPHPASESPSPCAPVYRRQSW